MNSSASSRKKILTLLQQKNRFIQKDFTNFTLQEHKSFDEGKRWSIKEKVLRLKSMMEAVQTEVHLCEESTWENTLLSVLEQKKINKILYGAKTSLSQDLGTLKQEYTDVVLELIDYKDPI